MFYAVSLEHEISRKESCWEVFQISYFEITWALLLEFDPHTTTLPFTLISQQQQETNLCNSCGKPALEKARYNNSYKESVILALHKAQTLVSNILNFRRWSLEWKKYWCDHFHYLSHFISLKVVVLLWRNYCLWNPINWEESPSPKWAAHTEHLLSAQKGICLCGLSLFPQPSNREKDHNPGDSFSEKEPPWEMTVS